VLPAIAILPHRQTLYESIKTNEFKIPDDDGAVFDTFVDPERTGYLVKEVSRRSMFRCSMCEDLYVCGMYVHCTCACVSDHAVARVAGGVAVGQARVCVEAHTPHESMGCAGVVASAC